MTIDLLYLGVGLVIVFVLFIALAVYSMWLYTRLICVAGERDELRKQRDQLEKEIKKTSY